VTRRSVNLTALLAPFRRCGHDVGHFEAVRLLNLDLGDDQIVARRVNVIVTAIINILRARGRRSMIPVTPAAAS